KPLKKWQPLHKQEAYSQSLLSSGRGGCWGPFWARRGGWMGNKFHGSINELKERIQQADLKGEWSEEATGKYSFRSQLGGVMNFWPSTGTVQFQGRKEATSTLALAVFRGAVATSAATAVAAPARQIFIVHGHDTTARDQLELALHRLGLEPFVLMNTGGGGKTIIEALEGKIDKLASAMS